MHLPAIIRENPRRSVSNDFAFDCSRPASVSLCLCGEPIILFASGPVPRYDAVAPKGPMANFFEPPRYIAVEGPIRVGKSTLSRYLAEQLYGQLVHEPEDNPFLGAFYEGETGAAFQ